MSSPLRKLSSRRMWSVRRWKLELQKMTKPEPLLEETLRERERTEAATKGRKGSKKEVDEMATFVVTCPDFIIKDVILDL